MNLIIKGRLPGLNEYTAACRRDPRAGARMKREAGELVGWAIKAARLGKITTPCRMAYTWYEANHRRDLDNICSFGRKVIQDSLVEAGCLPGDGWNHITGFSDRFEVDAKDPRIEIEFITEGIKK